jgi:UDP-N-acetylmuramoyl-L-alanyl-D-glutamate--2,6-diaminopimelate ligase
VRLDALLDGAGPLGPGVRLRGDAATEITGVSMDSRAVAPGHLFACVRGNRADGHSFAPDAVAKGASALLCERSLDLGVPEVIVPSVREALGPLASSLYGHPSRSLKLVGVTGTNGKTTTCALLDSIFNAHGWKATTIGTLTQERTTPEAPELQETLARFRDARGQAVAMEVSSHAIAQHRVDGLRFTAAVFTNLSLEHLDFHGSMDNYFEAKAQLFQPDRVAVAVVNRDDPWGRRLLDRLKLSGLPTEEFSLDEMRDVRCHPGRTQLRWRGVELTVRLGGRLNLPNVAAAVTCARALEIDADSIARGLSSLKEVPGRFQAIDAGQDFAVVVDYAHTPDGLAQCLRSARETIDDGRRVIVVFGAGGERDRSKRPAMGLVASELADLAVVTSDNPRGEEPLAIIGEIVRSMTGDAEVLVEPDRQSAIRLAVSAAHGGDVVVIAGKGHEKLQDLGGGRVIDFDDAEVATAALRAASRSGAPG